MVRSVPRVLAELVSLLGANQPATSKHPTSACTGLQADVFSPLICPAQPTLQTLSHPATNSPIDPPIDPPTPPLAMATFRPQRTQAPILALDAIPCLTQLYDRGALSAAASAAHPPNARLNARVGLVRHDITRIAADGIVNAANESLLGGGGVDGAVHRGAGPRLLDACVLLGGCRPGEAKATAGFDLPARKVVHTVGPVYYRATDKKRAAEVLRSCYRRSLEVGEQNRLTSLVFCPVATGIYGYPNEEAAEIAISEVRRYLDEGRGGNYSMVVFTNILAVDYDPYLALLP